MFIYKNGVPGTAFLVALLGLAAWSCGNESEQKTAKQLDAENGGTGSDIVQPEPDTTDKKEQSEIEKFLEENGVVKLLPNEQGVESGTAPTDEVGYVAFYSAQTQSLIELTASDEEDHSLGGMNVAVQVFSEDTALVFVTDPTGARAPAMYLGAVTDGTVSIDSRESSGDDELAFELDENAPSPFPGDKLSLVGQLSTLAIKSTLWSIAGSAVGAVFKKFAGNLCIFFAPLHKNACALVGTIAGKIGSTLVGGFRIRFDKGIPFGKALAKAGLSTVLSWAVEAGCEKAFGFGLAAVGPTTGEGNAMAGENEGLYKKAVWKVNYMLLKLDEDPPADPAIAQRTEGLLESAMKTVIQHRPFVQTDFFMAHSSTGSQKHFEETMTAKVILKSISDFASKVIKDIVPNQLTSVTSVPLYWQTIVSSSGTFTTASIDIDVTHVSTPDWLKSVKKFGPDTIKYGTNCALGMVKSYRATAKIAGVEQEFKFDHLQLANDSLEMLNKGLDAFYDNAWGGAIALPDCYPDLFEPNESWESAATSVNLGDAIEIDGLTLTPGDVDYFKLPITGWINAVTAGAAYRPSENDTDCAGGSSGQICLQMYYYSFSYTLTGQPPTAIGPETCGTVEKTIFTLGGPQVETVQLNVSPITGDKDQTLIVRVRQPSGQDADIPYTVFLYGNFF